MKKILTILGTRPEAIKLAPVILELEKHRGIQSEVCVTAQHRQMLDRALNLFGIAPDIDLDVMEPDQTLPELTARVMVGVDRVLHEIKPDMVLVQGDTTTVMAASMAAFYRGIRIGHVEAGLRSGNILSPFPEEMNRRIAGVVSSLHFAPTQRAVESLIREGTPEGDVFLTGNPVIDALRMTLNRPLPEEAGTILDKALNGGGGDLKLVLVTAHRRENFGKRLEGICNGLKCLVERNKDIVIIYPVHLNPNVQEPVYRILGDTPGVILTNPVDYDSLSHLMKAAHIVLTDSGGIQEEAPSLGKPVLVMRTETERPEGITAGATKLVGTSPERIVFEIELLLKDTQAYKRMAHAVNPYGDGRAAERIAEIVSARV